MKTKRFKGIVLAAVAIVAVMAAAAIYVIPAARHRNQNVVLSRQWAVLLRKHAAFSGRRPGYPIDVEFSYASPMDDNLTALRERYDLEAAAGRGSETDRIINLMRWVYRLTGHANEPEIPKELNALNLIPLAKEKHMMINCYMKTVILNEVYLAMGFESRQTHLLPAANEDEESHYVTSVFSRTLGWWILMDPDFGVYVTNEKGAILGIAEIRERLIAGGQLAVHAVDAPKNFLAQAWSDLRSLIDGTSYLWYLRKNIFKVECPQNSLFNQAAKPNRLYFELIPDGYHEELLRAPEITKRGNKVVFMNDEGLFWQKPNRAPAGR
jgi:hypothetical protein